MAHEPRKSDTYRKTAYIRFDLAERLHAINYINLVVSIILTVYLSGWAIFAAFFPDALNSHEKSVISYISVMATIALLCLTILDYMADRAVKARAFLQCGNKILKVADDFDHCVETGRSPFEMKRIADAYNAVLAESEWNHSGEDHSLYVKSANKRSSYLSYFSYSLALVVYYCKRVLLQLVVTAMVLLSTYFVGMSLYSRAPSNATSSNWISSSESLGNDRAPR